MTFFDFENASSRQVRLAQAWLWSKHLCPARNSARIDLSTCTSCTYVHSCIHHEWPAMRREAPTPSRVTSTSAPPKLDNYRRTVKQRRGYTSSEYCTEYRPYPMDRSIASPRCSAAAFSPLLTAAGGRQLSRTYSLSPRTRMDTNAAAEELTMKELVPFASTPDNKGPKSKGKTSAEK